MVFDNEVKDFTVLKRKRCFSSNISYCEYSQKITPKTSLKSKKAFNFFNANHDWVIFTSPTSFCQIDIQPTCKNVFN